MTIHFKVGTFKMNSLEQNDLFNFISLQMKILKLFGFWFYIPYKIMSFNFLISLLGRVVFGFFVFVLPTVGQALHILILVISRQTEIQDIASEINMLLMEIMISVQLLDLRCRREHFNTLLEYLNVNEFMHTSTNEKVLTKKGIQSSRKLFFGLTILATFDFLLHTVLITGWNGFQNLPVEMNYLVIDVHKEPVFTFVFLYQLIYKYLLIPIYASIQTIRWSFLLCAISQLEILILNLKGLKENNIIDFQIQFKVIVLHHCSIIRFVKEIENVFGGQLILFFILNACVMCTTLLQFVTSKSIFDVLWVFGFIFILASMLLIDCYYGTIITEKSAYISSVMYNYPWMCLPQFLKKYIIIANNQRSLVIRAGKLIPVSIQTFTKVMNWSYQGFALFNQMRK